MGLVVVVVAVVVEGRTGYNAAGRKGGFGLGDLYRDSQVLLPRVLASLTMLIVPTISKPLTQSR